MNQEAKMLPYFEKKTPSQFHLRNESIHICSSVTLVL